MVLALIYDMAMNGYNMATYGHDMATLWWPNNEPLVAHSVGT